MRPHLRGRTARPTRAAFHPQLGKARFLPPTTVLPWNLRLVRALGTVADRRVSGFDEVRIDDAVTGCVWRPGAAGGRRPAVLWIHGGGMVIGSARQDHLQCRKIADELQVVVCSVEYRLAPEHPFPVPLEDCYAALRWLASQPDVDAERIVVAGASAGGGLAAAVALLAKERGEVALAGQLLSYPMLDDRTGARTDVGSGRYRMWNPRSNRFGWRSYLGSPAGPDVPPLAAPARYLELGGLAPVWIGVGTNDLFHHEDVAYAGRLRQAGVSCQLEVVPGGYHAFDLIESGAEVSQTFTRSRLQFLQRTLDLEAPEHAPS